MYSARLRDRAVDLAFAASCFAAGFYDLVSSLLYSAGSVERGMIWQRWQFIILCALGATFIWFVSEFVERKSRRLDYVLTGYWIAQAFVLAFDRSEFTLTAKLAVKSFRFLGVFPVTYCECTPGIAVIIEAIVGFFACAYILHSLLAYSRAGNKDKAQPIIIGMSVFIAAVLSDSMVGWGVYNCIYLMELSFLVLIMCMGYSLNEMHLKTQDDLMNISDGLQKLEAAVNAAAESIVITDIKGAIQYVNPAFERMTGYSSSEVLNQNSGIVKSGKHDKAMYDNLWKTITDGGVWRGHFTNRKKDGSLFQEDAVISPIKNRNGEIVNFVAVKRDVTQELQLENELRHSQKMEALGRLASGVAHDFTNMLAIIMGHTQLIKAKLGSDEECAEHLNAIDDSTSRLSSLTGDLLAFAHQKSLSLRMSNLNRVISGMKDMLERTIDEKVELVIKVSDGKLMAEMDPDHIEQAIMYFVVNAVDAMPDGGRLTIETEQIYMSKKEALQCQDGIQKGGLPEGGSAVVTITDTGCGMSERVRARIFEPFFTTKGLGRSTGLGLSTAYGIVSQHKGNITVYSNPGKGTTFRIYLPLADKYTVSGECVVLNKASLDRTIVLIAEDNYLVRTVLVHILKDMGLDVLEAEDSVQAEQLFMGEKDRIKLLITDVMMPETGGLNLADTLRAIKPDLKVIFACGYPESHLRQTGVIPDGETVISKPLTKGIVAEAINRVMSA